MTLFLSLLALAVVWGVLCAVLLKGARIKP